MALVAPQFDEIETQAWLDALAEATPNLSMVTAGTPVNEVEGAIVYCPPPGYLARYPRLRLIVSLSAGVDGILDDPKLPNVPVARVMNPEIKALMREYIVYQVLRITRRFDYLENCRREGRWVWAPPDTPATDWRVLVLGLGHLGRVAAEALRVLGYQVSGWSRRVQTISGVRCVSGRSGLESVLPESDIVVCLLPLTAETRGLLNYHFFSKLPRGASLINAGRGQCIDEGDMLRALDTGALSRVTLDVFHTEPLPHNHVFWNHPRVNITPHSAAHPRPSACISQIVECIECCKRGAIPPGIVNRLLGY